MVHSTRGLTISMVLISAISALSAAHVSAEPVPGREISRTLIEKRDAGHQYVMEEINPYAIKIIKNSCIADYVSSVYETAPGKEIVKEYLDEKTRTCAGTVVTAGSVDIRCGDRSLRVAPSEQGLVRLPLQEIARLESRDSPVDISWHFAEARLTTTVNVTPEQRRQTIRIYLHTFIADKRLYLKFPERSDFDKSGSKLLDKVKETMPQYYRLAIPAGTSPDQTGSSPLTGESTPVSSLPRSGNQSVYYLVPTQQRLYFTYGDYTGNIVLPVIEFNESPRSVEATVSIINNVLPSYQNEDSRLKVDFKDSIMRITNKTNSALQVSRLSLYFNGTFIDNITALPIELAPGTTSSGISLAAVIERDLGLRAKHNALTAQEAQQVHKNFGFGAAYQDPATSAVVMMSGVNRYSVYEQVKNPAETARLDNHMAALLSGSKKPASEVAFDLMVEFDSGKAEIRDEYLETLKKVGMALQKYPDMKGSIEGHSDNVGDKVLNQKLSERRAEAVKEYLVRFFNIDPARIQVAGFGMSRPRADNNTATGRAHNRRIEGRYIGFAD